MPRRDFTAFAIAIILLLTLSGVSAAQKIRQLELFGVPLKGATRDQLRQAFRQNGMQPISESNYADVYDPRNVLEGASKLEVGFVKATDQFAIAAYTFSAFMDTQLIRKVINMVSTKYGRPSSQSGDYALGPVKALWNMGQDMKIEVSRGWPDTTTFLYYIDNAAFNKMKAEIVSDVNSRERQKAQSQNKAF